MTTTASIHEPSPVSDGRSTGAGSWVAFCLLALYGTFRWGTMLEPPDQGRLLLALMLAVLNAAALRRLPRRGNRDWLVPVLCVLDAALVLLIAGFPFDWVLGGQWGHLGSAISDGISAVPGVLVPYRGEDLNTVAVIALGAGALLLCAGLAFGNVQGTPATGQLLLAALPLLALTIVPSAIVSPKFSFFHGLLTFTLVALLVLSPRLPPARRGGGTVLLIAAAVLGMVIAGLVAGSGRPWLRVATGHSIGTGLGSGTGSGPESFNWAQSYGKLGPNSSATVLEVTARRAAYWKTEDLDDFTGARWSQGSSEVNGLLGVSAARKREYEESIKVEVKDMVSSQFVTAGYALAPTLLGVMPGTDPGVWTTATPINSGTSYDDIVYVPDPSVAQLAVTGTSYPAALDRFRALRLPSGDAYAGVEALASRLSAGTRTPIAYVESVLSYLQPGHGFTYTLSPPEGGRYPLVRFLLDTKHGYCQQFAGAMALLLRMRHIPARVAVGFSTGTQKPHSDTYVVTGKDAHAWVEVWFPSYGWVTFDPTPGGLGTAAGGAASTSTTPAGTVSGAISTPATSTTPLHTRRGAGPNGRLRTAGDGGSGAAATPGGGLPVGMILLILVGAGVLWSALVWLRGYIRRPSVAELTEELGRAFAICGEPLDAGVTLTALGQRLTDSAGAATYIRSLAASRYAPGGASPTARGRAALRLWLARRVGPLGIIRALRALPPRRSPRAPIHR